MLRLRSFRQRVFAALLAVAVVPTAAALLVGTLALGEVVSGSGTAGPWDSVAESGQALLDALEGQEGEDPALARASERHRAALSESVVLSRRLSFVSERLLRILPLAAVSIGILAAVLSLLVARRLSLGFSRPIRDVVGWTERIAHHEPLPTPTPGEAREVEEFARLRSALRSMARELDEGRSREIESAKLRSWTEMARRVAHEIKNPLTPMRIAAERVARTGWEGAVEAGEVLLEEISRLDEMARSFSQFGRMPEGPTSEIDLTELLATLARQHETADVPIRVVVTDRPPLVPGHYDALLRVFRNLLANAVEAVTEARNGPGRVDVEVVPMAGSVSVRILDTGRGFPPDALSRVWDPDFTTRSRGTGLGLALVRQTIRAHGGVVEADNRPEGGAVVRVMLPVAEASPATHPDGEAP